MVDEVTRKMREALAKSADTEDKMGIWPMSYEEKDRLFKIAQKQHDLECVMHDAKVSDESCEYANDNFCKNLYFAANMNQSYKDWVKAAALCAIASGVTWIFW